MRYNSTKSGSKTLTESNAHLQSKEASSYRIRSLASSTAIETGESVAVIEKKLQKGKFSNHCPKLA